MAQHDPSISVSAATQQLLAKLDDDLPTIVPEELVVAQFKQAGCNCDDNPQLVKLVAVAGQHFLSTVLNDAAALARRRAVAQPRGGGRAKDAERRLVLGPEDAAQSLRDYGVNVRPAPYYVNPPGRR
ncbi:transcription initiation factor TFIID subunit 10 [Raphidocelis subcapitata]|uniref:Transcription initiation factor TFIID subunit 10 n=1 Tax=Raphidocelis subcapitata TaxID=307507 RepID=A0A2V0PHZ0_9CHLO|nr:transcription initiation factor TFIID subunit 10 [Raphidocelis subcapitata]|eukprot:GBF99346.1 transcription initiation factor TFIID subunit 10 [Raphidocelis subcapitata]